MLLPVEISSSTAALVILAIMRSSMSTIELLDGVVEDWLLEGNGNYFKPNLNIIILITSLEKSYRYAFQYFSGHFSVSMRHDCRGRMRLYGSFGTVSSELC